MTSKTELQISPDITAVDWEFFKAIETALADEWDSEADNEAYHKLNQPIQEKTPMTAQGIAEAMDEKISEQTENTKLTALKAAIATGMADIEAGRYVELKNTQKIHDYIENICLQALARADSAAQ